MAQSGREQVVRQFKRKARVLEHSKVFDYAAVAIKRLAGSTQPEAPAKKRKSIHSGIFRLSRQGGPGAGEF
jgi:hypothetical protein